MPENSTTYSFSRINFECGHAFYRSYILGEKGESNAWADAGKFMHNLFEDVANGKQTQQQILKRYDSEYYSAVEHDFPKFDSGFDLKPHYYKKCRPFFERKKYWNGEIVDVEKHVVGKLPSGAMFQGYIDLLVRHNGELIMVDHKISKRFSPSDLAKKQRQLYIYAYLLHLETGEYPDKLVFNFFQDASKPIIIPFSEYFMKEAVDWAEERIRTIESMSDAAYLPDMSIVAENDLERGFFCKNLCNHRNTCPYIEGDFFKQ